VKASKRSIGLQYIVRQRVCYSRIRIFDEGVDKVLRNREYLIDADFAHGEESEAKSRLSFGQMAENRTDL